MTPDTAALRAQIRANEDAAAFYGGTPNRIILDPDTVRALCDAADEVERLRANGNGYLQRAHAAEAVIERMRCAHCGEVGCDWIGDIRKARAEMAEAERDASRTALVAELRALRPDHRHRGASWGDGDVEYVSSARLRAALDRHAPTLTTTED